MWKFYLSKNKVFVANINFIRRGRGGKEKEMGFDP